MPYKSSHWETEQACWYSIKNSTFSSTTCTYKFYIKPIIQYGVLVYGCVTPNKLHPILVLQKKMLRLIYFKNYSYHTETLFKKHSILTVLELHMYELSKFVFRSIRNDHDLPYLNQLPVPSNRNSYNTRNTSQNISYRPFCRTKTMEHLIKYRGTRLLNFVRTNNLIPSDLHLFTKGRFSAFCHKFCDNFVFQEVAIFENVL